MSLFRFLTGVLGGTALGLLFAKKEGKKLRKQMEGKSSKEIAELIGKEMMSVGKDVQGEAKKVAKSKKVQDMVAKGKTEAKKLANQAEEMIEEEIRKATPKAKKAVKKATATAKKTTKKATSTAKKTVKKATTTAKKTVKKATKAVKKATSK